MAYGMYSMFDVNGPNYHWTVQCSVKSAVQLWQEDGLVMVAGGGERYNFVLLGWGIGASSFGG